MSKDFAKCKKCSIFALAKIYSWISLSPDYFIRFVYYSQLNIIVLKTFTSSAAVAALLLCSAAASATSIPGQDITRYLWRGNHQSAQSAVFGGERRQLVESAVARMESGRTPRFAGELQAVNPDGTYEPDLIVESRDLYGDLDGPDGDLWYYHGEIHYDYVKHNDYWTEALPKSFEVSIYDGRMQLQGVIKDTFELKDDEARVRLADLLPIVTRKYFNQDDRLEIAMTVIVNPKPYGVRPYTYVYSIDNEKDANGDDVPVRVINGMVSDVLDASDANGENVIMTFMHEYNDSGLTEEDIYDSEDTGDPIFRENFWNYNLGNKIGMTSYARVDDKGEFTEVFTKTTRLYQAQGNQQDDLLSITMVHNGKPVIVYPYYEDLVYEPFYSQTEDMVQRQPNNLVIEVYEQPAVGEKFVLKQTTRIPVVKGTESDVIYSYYAIGSFRYRDDVVFNGDKADFFVTRRDYLAGDNERQSFFAYNADGTLKRDIFANTDSHTPLSNLDGFDPMELFISKSDNSYIFNFVNMRTFETELSLDYGLMLEGDDGEPDYMMANLDRALTADGKSFYYVAEMRAPGYDDINDINYMRVVWLNRDGSFNHMDNINMGSNVNYATLYLNSIVLRPDFFLSDSKQEYMMLIKRAHTDGTTEEQLLVAQAADKQNPAGKDLLLLGNSEAGVLKSIVPQLGSQNRLAVTYVGSEKLTTYYYNLPLDVVSGIESVAGANDGDITVSGSIVSAAGAIEIYNSCGIRVATGHDSIDLSGLASGIYIARTATSAVKIAVK